MAGVNHLAVWIAGVVQFLLGAAWYSLLSAPWMAGIGKTEAQLMADNAGSPAPYIIGLVAALAVAYGLAWLLPKLDAQSAIAGATAGIVLALVFIGSTMAMNYGFEQRPLSLWLINAGYMTVGMAVMGGIIGGWKRRNAG
jgi:hypothetical protein